MKDSITTIEEKRRKMLLQQTGSPIIGGLRGKPINPRNGYVKFRFTPVGLVRDHVAKKRQRENLYKSSTLDRGMDSNCSPKTTTISPSDSFEDLTLEARFLRRHKIRRLSFGNYEYNGPLTPNCPGEHLSMRESKKNPLNSFQTILEAASEIEDSCPKMKSRIVSLDQLSESDISPTLSRQSELTG